MYGAIHRDLAGILTGGTHYETILNHNLRTSNFCTFLAQDVTVAGAPQGGQRLFVPNATKTAISVVVQDWTNVGAPCHFDTVLFSHYSVLDVGPIATGATRTAAQTSPNVSLVRPSYRSMHHLVPVTCTAGQLTGNVLITHNLCTRNVAVFVTPLMDPFDTTGYPIQDVIRFWENQTVRLADATGTTCQVIAQRGDGLPFASTQTLLLDVMVIGMSGVGHSTTDIPVTGTGDYAFGDRAVLPRLPSYWTLYRNVDFIPLAPGINVTHNLRGAAATCLFGLTGVLPGPVPIAFETPYVRQRGAAATINVAEVGGPGPLNDAWTLVMRPYSTCCPTLV